MVTVKVPVGRSRSTDVGVIVAVGSNSGAGDSRDGASGVKIEAIVGGV